MDLPNDFDFQLDQIRLQLGESGHGGVGSGLMVNFNPSQSLSLPRRRREWREITFYM